ncbi:hypothetical protein [Foetidibacter luteolus]|uniref:hypothetical protein n=1 Tax=Foetidibacter luteolus TaxID=2608880 RepID=UPI001A99CD8C|nr:hypothetical protein [Foetidibacter luteolus]
MFLNMKVYAVFAGDKLTRIDIFLRVAFLDLLHEEQIRQLAASSPFYCLPWLITA